MANLLVVDDEKGMRDMLRIVLVNEGHSVLEASDGVEGLEAFRTAKIDLVVQDLRMPRMDGHVLLQRIKEIDPEVPVIVITAYDTWESAVQAMRLGAFDYIRKPFDNDLIRAIITRALEMRERKGAPAKETFLPPMEIVGNTASMREIFRIVKSVASTNTTILIQGESGTGKEAVARNIHYWSMRSSGPFIAVNCGAFPESLLESELFGHVRGSFTGAVADKRGLLEAANGGTFFLDEVGDLARATQVKLLRVIEDRRVTPVGATTPKQIDVRFVAATNKNLEEEVRADRFREDLFYRLNVIPVSLPPLREREGDIPLLAGHFLAKYAKEMQRPITGIDPRSMDGLVAYGWPGNVREMQNLIHRAVTLTEDQGIIAVEIPPMRDGGEAGLEDPLAIPEAGLDLEERLAAIEKRFLERALAISGGKMTRAAKLLGLSFRSMRYKVKKYEL